MSQAQRVSRRGYVRYAGAGIAVVAVVGAGAYYSSILKPTPSLITPSITVNYTSTKSATLVPPNQTHTITSTAANSSKETQTTSERYSIYGQLFFDYNGNGRIEGEKPIVNAAILLKDKSGKVIEETESNSGGYYGLAVDKGFYKLYIETDKKFRHICRSVGEVREIGKGYDVVIEQDKSNKFDVGLMEGYLTLPFSRKAVVKVSCYVDLDERAIDPHRNTTRDWQGLIQTYDGHRGIDYLMDENTPILAAASGTTIESKYDKIGGNYVSVQHFDGKITFYNHLSIREVSFGERVKRGEIIGYSGMTGTWIPHLHFGLYKEEKRNEHIDPFRDLSDSSSISWWTKDNHPQYPD